MDVRALKDRAREFFLRGKFEKAARTYRELIEHDPSDCHVRIRHADACRRAGNDLAAVASYRAAATLLAKREQWAQARAALKVALEVLPGDPSLNRELESLESSRTSELRVRGSLVLAAHGA